MCMKKQPKPQAPAPAPAVLPQPEKVAEEQEIGAARKKEDEALFPEGTPQLRTDRSAVSGGVAATGTGLRMM